MASNERRLARRPARALDTADPWGSSGEYMGLAPMSAFARMSRFMDDLRGEEAALLPAPLDVTETDDSYILTAEVPGVQKGDITIETRDHTLTVRGEKKAQREEKGERAYRMERQYGVFSRSIALPEDADAEQTHASFQNGVLRITVAKKPETKARTIEIAG